MKEIFDSSEYVQLISSISSLKELMTLEFRRGKNIQWEPMACCEDSQKKKYLCNVCNVCQYGDKNLLSHLSGKKHIGKIDTISQVFLPSAPGRKPNGSAQMETGGKKVLPGNTSMKPEKAQNKTVTDGQPNKPQAKTTPNESLAKSRVPLKILAKTTAAGSPKTGIKPSTITNHLEAKVVLTTNPKVPNKTNSKIVAKDAAKVATTPNAKTNVQKKVGPPILKTSAEVVNKAKSANVDTLKVAATSNTVKMTANPLNKSKPAQPNISKAITATNLGINVSKATSRSIPQTTSETNKAIPISLVTTKSKTTEVSILKSYADAVKPGHISSSTVCKVEVSHDQNSNLPKETSTPVEVKPVIFNIKSVVSIPKKSFASNVKKINEGKPHTISDMNRKIVKVPLLPTTDNFLMQTSIEEGLDEQNDDSDGVYSSGEHCKNDEKSIQKKAIASTTQNIVINPLSAVANDRKIFCVPLSKLMSSNAIETNKRSEEPEKLSGSKAIETISKRAESSRHTYVRNKNSTDRSIENISTRNTTGRGTNDSILNSSPLALLGVEYVIKIVKNMSDKLAKYHCSLCSIATDETSMLSHLVGYNHRLKYCEKHFQTALRQFKQYIAHVPEHMVFNVLSPMLEKLAVAIEKHHGRESAYICYEHLYMKNKIDVTLNVFNRRHASELSGPSFTHVVDTTEVAALIESATSGNHKPTNIVANTNFTHPVYNDPNELFRNLDVSSNYSNYPCNNSASNGIDTVDDETHKRMVDNFLRDTQKTQSVRNRNLVRGEKRTLSRSKSPELKRRRSSSTIKSQWNLERRSISPLRDEDIWQAYRHMVDQSVRELNATFELYTTDPEQHPLYNEEWQKFWKRRKDELIANGINHRTYNFQNEWIHFFNARLEELYNQDVENIKIKCRDRLCLPMTNNELINSKYHVHISGIEPNQVDCPEMPEVQTEESVVDTVDEVNVIHVLRLLTALEDFLGSLGPKVTQLLGTALQMSKLHPDKANSQFLTSENCAILETAKEKFTGLVISKILDPTEERAVKRAINDTETLLKYAAKIGEQSANDDVELDAVRQKSLQQKSTNKADIPKKSDLVSKLVSTLISQGKTSINQDQLLQIVQVYSYIEQKKNQKQDVTSTSRLNSSNLPNRSSAEVEHRVEDRSDPNNELASYATASNHRNSNRSAFTNNIFNSITNPSMMRDMSNMNSSVNYSSVDMARSNNSNMINHNGRDFSYNGQNHSQYQQYDHGMFSGGNPRTQPNMDEYNNRNFQPNYTDGNYIFGSNNNNAGGQRMDWN